MFKQWKCRTEAKTTNKKAGKIGVANAKYEKMYGNSTGTMKLVNKNTYWYK